MLSIVIYIIGKENYQTKMFDNCLRGNKILTVQIILRF